MNIVFRVNVNTSDEILMGHKLWFSEISGVEAISATASTDGFTPLNALARTYGWNRDLIDIATAQCNLRREVVIVSQVEPTLLLVPKTVGRLTYKHTIEGYAIELLMAAKHLRIEWLHFTHFGFIQSPEATKDFVRILEIFMNPLIELSLRELIWEIDFRGLKALEDAYDEVRTRFHIPENKPFATLLKKYLWEGSNLQERNKKCRNLDF
jgi:hypothetical protein